MVHVSSRRLVLPHPRETYKTVLINQLLEALLPAPFPVQLESTGWEPADVSLPRCGDSWEPSELALVVIRSLVEVSRSFHASHALR